MDASPLFKLERAKLGYPGQVILDGIDLMIPRGSFFVLSGPNGGGKTTLLKSLGGLLPLLGGSLLSGEARIGYVPQAEKIDSAIPITARELVEAGASGVHPWWRGFHGSDRAECRKHLKACHADHFANRLFSELSGGQRQRVLLARALSVRPNCLLLDEPTSGIDRETKRLVTDLLADLNRSRHMTILLIAHDLEAFHGAQSHFGTVKDGKVLVELGKDGSR